MKKLFCKLLSILLVATLLVQLVPASVFAVEEEPSAQSTSREEMTTDHLTEGEENTESGTIPSILFEEESLREESVKHFRMDDGSYIAVQYGTPVHYEENGQWVEYDN
ncbi:MAG: hypothetical protein II272_01710, partial [Oscillospiraceae bacterium]|nr:hypothetical protein [Oscillospiraceae bacterium]